MARKKKKISRIEEKGHGFYLYNRADGLRPRFRFGRVGRPERPVVTSHRVTVGLRSDLCFLLQGQSKSIYVLSCQMLP
ncbi:hypothetical protein VTK73DRAFT_2120 [Phialemonium thermophilum]|uniref:Uncharacterized protein n=1 Tax=Phialemonium thermophilum TaxID=223376 RepID=A0ABR3X6S2_9PEZI